MFKVLPIIDKELFLKYAIPCGNVLVERGELEKEVLENLNNTIKHGQNIEMDAERPIEDIFKVASRMCTILAKQSNKTAIDSEIIRRYFLVEHDKAIAWRRQVKPDIDVKECSVKAGKVVSINNDGVLVHTKIGEKICRPDFAKNLKVNDWVSVHYNYIGEKLRNNYRYKLIGRGL